MCVHDSLVSQGLLLNSTIDRHDTCFGFFLSWGQKVSQRGEPNLLSRKFIRENPQLVEEAARGKGQPVEIEQFLKLDSREGELSSTANQLRHQQRLLSQQGSLSGHERRISPSLKQLARQVKAAKEELRGLQKQLKELLLRFPNIPDPSVPQGRGKKDNLQVREWGTKPQFDFTPLPYWELAERLGIWDFRGGVKVAGRGFVLFKGAGSKLERALADFMLDLYTSQHDYVELSPPLLADQESLTCTGHFPRWQQGVYCCKDDGLFLIPSAEVPLTNLHRDQILDAQSLPFSYVACTPCFRRPEGSWGRENRQEMRLHQFRKIELIEFVAPESSSAQLDQVVTDVEEALQLLGLPYRIVLDCVGQLSFASAKVYGVEVWMAASGSYLRVCSCRNYTDFQARRGNIRFRPNRGGRPGFVHTLGASGPALPRLMAAIIENCQTATGEVLVPKVLQRYMNDPFVKSPKYSPSPLSPPHRGGEMRFSTDGS